MTDQSTEDPYASIVESLQPGLIVSVNRSIDSERESGEMVVQRTIEYKSGPVAKLKSGETWYRIEPIPDDGYELSEIDDRGHGSHYCDVVSLEVLGIDA